MSTSTTQAPATRRVDWGRIVMVPLCVGLVGINVVKFASMISGPVDLPQAARLAGLLLALAFFSMVVVAYLRRSQATATSRSVSAGIAALIATPLPFVFPLLTSPHDELTTVLMADVVLLAGLSWSVWSVRTLGRSLSVLAQARTLVATGPYRLVRHPLYLGELLAALGIVLQGFTAAALLLWIGLVALQAYRARQEESLLSDTIDSYAAYKSRTALLIPGVI